MRKLTTEDFIEGAKAVHGDKYDYSKVKYVGAHTKAVIICPEHGEFKKTLGDHLRKKQGCPKCQIEAERAAYAEKFKAEAGAKYNYKYDYSKVEYVNAKTKVVIVCPVHGEFEQKPDSHLNSGGCRKCGGTERKTTEEWIAEAKALHGDKYDYSLVNYKTCNDEVEIICNTCGAHFPQRPHDHAPSGKGCPECGKKKVAEVSRKTQRKKASEAAKRFEARARAIHKDKYDYSRVEYVNRETEVTIICPIHGEFTQKPFVHINRKAGCQKCAKVGFLSHEHGSLYIMVDDLEVPNMMKIGVSVRVDERRKDVLKRAKKAGARFSDLHVIKTWEGTTDDMQTLEKAMHQALSQYKINFTEKFDGCREFFYYRPEVFELVEEHLKKFANK
ncbi:GIY-YIG nuclease family protein [Escherichia coli]|nr:GIY-YIG nuclease family protein [Escherichia coli]